jgi:hypothetical protein
VIELEQLVLGAGGVLRAAVEIAANNEVEKVEKKETFFFFFFSVCFSFC